MKTVIRSDTGKVLFAIQEGDEVYLKDGEQIIDATCDLPYDSETEIQVWDFNTKSFSIQQK